ncbi:MAG: hypothetical protein HOE11_00950 [Candidatus Diapherotrites archaeon]|nr:hypothetical protein [Candidatus Diapherotrites archaeon]MBT4596543.1 hypothetical protein [Candidatus Diapherotrites archaeon]
MVIANKPLKGGAYHGKYVATTQIPSSSVASIKRKLAQDKLSALLKELEN